MSNPDSSRKKRRRIGSGYPEGAPAEPCGPRWRTDTEQQIYSSKLVDALRGLRRPDTAVAAANAVRDAADRVLAVSAKGRTRWSRALLNRRLSLRLSQIQRKHKRAARPGAESKKPAAQKKLPPVQRKVRDLGRLVPGCRKVSLPSLLEETTDYIAALEMQVKAMAFISGLLNGVPGGGAGGRGGSLAI
ncbi:transcription factor bhlh147 [Phtheirospermum japonicum]|uniref:Transcription factor bhlh147 n=1 Tax=Phtheirospermum japonicum TaxID=374723 RepID=A0A830BSN2_9LAMI|nr:transcription factor bhlh147 [Phtheirospermum japonicum]